MVRQSTIVEAGEGAPPADRDAAVLRYIARVLGELHSRYRRNGLHWPIEMEAVLRLASDGQTRPTFDGDADTGDALAIDYERAARRLSVSRRTLGRLVASGQLPRVDIGGCRRITTADIEAYVEGLRRERTA